MFIESLEGRRMFSTTDAAAVDPNAQATTGPQPQPTVTVDLHCTKKVDAASPNLFLACATGKHFPSSN